MHAPRMPPTAPGTRGALVRVLGALVVVQVLHTLDVLRYDDEARAADLADPIAVLGIGVTVLALVAVVRCWEQAPAYAIAAGGAVAFGFLLVHGIPFEVGELNEPYWGEHADADAIQWLTVLGAMALGVAAMVLGNRLDRRPARTQPSFRSE